MAEIVIGYRCYIDRYEGQKLFYGKILNFFKYVDRYHTGV